MIFSKSDKALLIEAWAKYKHEDIDPLMFDSSEITEIGCPPAFRTAFIRGFGAALQVSRREKTVTDARVVELTALLKDIRADLIQRAAMKRDPSQRKVVDIGCGIWDRIVAAVAGPLPIPTPVAEQDAATKL